MAATKIISLRIDPDLLEALRERAKHEGRSLSAEVLRILRRAVEPVPRATRGRSMGMFDHLEAPELSEFKQVRRAASAAVHERSRKRRKSA